MIIGTKIYYPEASALYRNDFLFLAAVAFQLILLFFKLETPKEALVIIIFHLVATGMEIFKTSDAIRSWHYPGDFVIGVGNVPLFAGFMYSAVGSYIARVWRIFHFRFTNYPPTYLTWVLVGLIYLNFFTHHYTYDIRILLCAFTLVLFGRSWIFFKVDKVYRKMPLVFGWLLVAFFIWLAENISTYAGIWFYPSQKETWHLVPFSKLIAWFLLLLLSFVLVSLIHKPEEKAS